MKVLRNFFKPWEFQVFQENQVRTWQVRRGRTCQVKSPPYLVLFFIISEHWLAGQFSFFTHWSCVGEAKGVVG